MTTRPHSLICSLPTAASAISDRALLEAVQRGGDETAFEELVRRHGPMVLRVCRRVLGHRQDAEDAFQAAFIVLLRRAGRIEKPDSLGSWLHGVAFRVSRELLALRRRRQEVESGATAPEVAAEPVCPAEHADLVAALDQALTELPLHYRAPIVLCELQDRSRKEAAQELGVPEGTLSSRLAKAKKLLAERLSQRGFPVAAIGAVLASRATAAVPAPLVDRTVRVLLGASLDGAAGAAGVVNQVANGVVAAMVVGKLKGIAFALVVGVVILGVVVAAAVGGPAGTDHGNPATHPVGSQPDALVRQLGSAEFAEREAAEQQLRKLGAQALPALRAGARSEDPEVVRRCQQLLGEIRRNELKTFVAAFLADKERTGKFDHPVWKRFVSLAGDSRASRDLFALVIADPRRAQLLDTAEAFPSERARLYRDEAAKQSCDAFFVVASETVGGHTMLMGGPKASDLKPPPEPVTQASLAAYFVLGSYPETAVAVPGKDRAGRKIREAEPVATWAFDKAAGDFRSVIHRLFAAWIDRRVDGETLESAYWWATSRQIAEAVPAARRLLTANKAPAPAQAYAAVYLSRYGDRTDLARIEHLLADTTVARDVLYDKPAPVQVRDAALAASLSLCGANLADFGFDVIRKRRDSKGDAFDMAWLGFWSDESRTAAHTKAREWLRAEAKKQKP